MDQHGPLQQGEDQEGRHRGQDRLQEEPGSADQAVSKGGAGEAAQLPQGRALHQPRGGRGYLHHHGALAGEQEVRPHSLPSSLLQTRHQAAHPRTPTREAQGGQQVRSFIYLEKLIKILLLQITLSY